MMIPLRRAFIVKQHGTLSYPEGTACADVLIVGEQGGASAKTVFTGFGIAFVYQFLWQGLQALEGDRSAARWPGSRRRHAGDGGQSGAAGRGLHHRHADLLHHGGRRRAGLVRAHSGDPLLRRRADRSRLSPATVLISQMSERGHPSRPTCSTSARGRGRRRHHQPLPGPAADLRLARAGLARPARQRRLRIAGAASGPTATSRCASSASARWCWCSRSGPSCFGAFGQLSMGATLIVNLVGRTADRALRLPVRHGLLAADRRDRLLVESDLRHDGGHAAADLPDLPRCSAGRARRTG